MHFDGGGIEGSGGGGIRCVTNGYRGGFCIGLVGVFLSKWFIWWFTW